MCEAAQLKQQQPVILPCPPLVVVYDDTLVVATCNVLMPLQEDARPAGIERGFEGERWEPVSPRKHISQRRRTADELAEKAAKAGTVFDIPGHPNTFGALADSEENTHEVSPDERDSDKLANEGLDEGSRYAWYSFLSVLVCKTSSTCNTWTQIVTICLHGP